MAELIFVSNPGSSSKKYALFDGDHCLFSAQIETNHEGIVWHDSAGTTRELTADEYTHAARVVYGACVKAGLISDTQPVPLVGVRVVAPGSDFQKHAIITEAYIARLYEIQARDPLHITPVLTEIAQLRELFPEANHVGVSDSAFHQSIPKHIRSFGIPKDLALQNDWYRFGYHGISVAWAMQQLDKLVGHTPMRTIVLHLGSGSSVTAVHAGVSVDTSMGYSPLDGVLMATRPGWLDPLVVHELAIAIPDASTRRDFLFTKCGIGGVSGISTDLRTILTARESGSPEAQETLDQLVYSIAKNTAAMLPALGGLDALVLTGTIAERSEYIRTQVARALAPIGVTIATDQVSERTDSRIISPAGATVLTAVVTSDEVAAIARIVRTLEIPATTTL
jgi:acetate kinase